MRFIAEHKDRTEGGLRWGVEPICVVLREQGCPIAPSTYYDAAKRPCSRRQQRDEVLKAAITRVHAENLGVYGARKVWLALNREGTAVARGGPADARAGPGRGPPRTPGTDHHPGTGRGPAG